MPKASAAPSSDAHESHMQPQDWFRLIQESQEAWIGAANRLTQPASPRSALHLGKAYMELYSALAADPAKFFARQTKLWQDGWQLMVESAQSFLDPAAPRTNTDDKRFKDIAWEEHAALHYLKQAYLLVSEHIQRTVEEESEHVDPHTARSLSFYTRQFLDAASPSNLAYLNPEVIRTTLESRGDNLRHGWQNLLEDMAQGRIRMSSPAEFKLGETLAATPGAVVYENELMQLIQYAPATKQVHAVPILLIPAWINKFYILDLKPENSLVKWLTEQGYTVFCISWVNPTAAQANTRFDDYMRLGPVAALDAIEQATGEKKVHMAGYCLGGTLLAIALAWMSAQNKAARVASATYFTTMVDFKEPGDLGVFIDEEQIADLETRMQSQGYLDGREMALTFNMLRARDLIWSFVVNNYMLGRQPMPFDLLYWNADATRLPAAMHSFYLRNMYLNNRLKEPGGIIVDHTAIDLSQIETPSYVLSAREDHIAPWESTYAATQLYKGPVRFVLASSGHIAGVINPPAKKKYSYFTENALPAEPKSWFSHAREHAGSWWGDWAAWLAPQSGGMVAARKLGSGKLTAIEPAPGRYVKDRCD